MSQTTVSHTLTSSQPMPFTADLNLRRLHQRTRDVITGVVGTAMKVSNPVIDGTELLFKNGVLLTPTVQYTVDADGLGIKLGSAAIAGDYFVALYFFRSTR